jgi:hypothetical protein
VRFRRYRFSPTGELGYSGIRGAVGLEYRFTVPTLCLPIVLLTLFYCFSTKLEAKVADRFY